MVRRGEPFFYKEPLAYLQHLSRATQKEKHKCIFFYHSRMLQYEDARVQLLLNKIVISGALISVQLATDSINQKQISNRYTK